MKKTVYLIIAGGQPNVEERVSQLLNEGWDLAPGLAAFVDSPAGGNFEPMQMFAQPMLRTTDDFVLPEGWGNAPPPTATFTPAEGGEPQPLELKTAEGQALNA